MRHRAVRLLYAMDVAEGFRAASPWMEEAESWMATARLLEPDTVAGYLDQIEEYGPRDARVRSALTDAGRRVGR